MSFSASAIPFDLILLASPCAPPVQEAAADENADSFMGSMNSLLEVCILVALSTHGTHIHM